MTRISLMESELKQLKNSKYYYNSNGFILMEYGPGNCHHVRLDLGRHDNGTKKKYSAGDYEFLVEEFHVKISAGDNRYHYAFYEYLGGGIWRFFKSLLKVGESHKGKLTSNELSACDRDARGFLEDLREITTSMDQMLAVDAPPEMLR